MKRREISVPYNELEIDGHEFVVRPYIPLYDDSSWDRHIIDGKWLVRFHGSHDRDTLLRIAGYDASKVDYAVPQSFFDENGSGYCWYYGNHETRLFGEPLKWQDVMDKAEQRLLAVIEAS